jgi:hypothetical protein
MPLSCRRKNVNPLTGCRTISEPERSAGKLRVYQILASLNERFEQISADLRRLRELPCFRRELLDVFHVAAQETRSWINFELVETMHQQADWAHFGRLRCGYDV